MSMSHNSRFVRVPVMKATALAVGLALALIIESIRHPIRTVAALTNVTGVPPLAIVPVLSTKIDREKRLFLWKRKLQSDKGVNL